MNTNNEYIIKDIKQKIKYSEFNTKEHSWHVRFYDNIITIKCVHNNNISINIHIDLIHKIYDDGFILVGNGASVYGSYTRNSKKDRVENLPIYLFVINLCENVIKRLDYFEEKSKVNHILEIIE